MPSNLYTALRENVNSAIAALQGEGFLPADLNTAAVAVEQPREEAHGDFATNAALVLAKPAAKSPREIAERLATTLASGTEVDKVEVAGPGFLNFTLKPGALVEQVKNILQSGEIYGKSAVGGGEKVLLEFVSANPTGPLHFGHARGAVYGDALANLLAFTGYDLSREYLINDAGEQVRHFAVSVLARHYGIEDERVQYKGHYVEDAARAAYARLGDKTFPPVCRYAENGLPEIPPELPPVLVDICMENIREDLAEVGIFFPEGAYFSEAAMQAAGKTAEAEATLREKGYIYEGTLPPPKGKAVEDYTPEEMTLFRASDFGDDSDRPFKKPDGSYTYFGSDVAYHLDKLSRGHHTLINLWGADHAGAVKRLRAALEALSGRKDALEVQLMQMVRLFRNGEPVKMSKRAGTFVTMREVVEEVGPDAVRFWLLTRKADTQMDFDLAKAIEKNNDNPVFYVQYAHARMCSVLRQLEELRAEHPSLPAADTVQSADFWQAVDLSSLGSDHEMRLIRHLCAWPVVVERAAVAREPHRVAFYAHELAGRFHAWYNEEKFLLPEEPALTAARLTLMLAARQVLLVTFSILGVSAPDKM